MDSDSRFINLHFSYCLQSTDIFTDRIEVWACLGASVPGPSSNFGSSKL